MRDFPKGLYTKELMEKKKPKKAPNKKNEKFKESSRELISLIFWNDIHLGFGIFKEKGKVMQQ